MKFQLVATCLFGLEKLVGEEIDALGYKRVETIDGRVTFEAPPEAVAVCNVNFRFAERLYIIMGSFYANTFEQLFQGVKNIPWEQYIGEYDAFPVKGHSIKSKLFSIPDCQKIIKKAVVTRFDKKQYFSDEQQLEYNKIKGVYNNQYLKIELFLYDNFVYFCFVY